MEDQSGYGYRKWKYGNRDWRKRLRASGGWIENGRRGRMAKINWV